MKNTEMIVRRGVYLKDPQTGEEVCRRDYIKTLYLYGSEKYNITPGDRRSILNHLKERFDHTTYFQIVFQATAGCERPTMDMNHDLISKVSDQGRKAVEKVIEDSKKSQDVIDRVTNKVRS